ncbi:hypothetical protein NitYY0826_C0432 [Nitratiruptor sp. YY08-26]|nr:hypothetical protein NitYY0813_C0431 [Nitratiruptor sp. YY08-13]BCD65511.1 hypothetical protein NitYY0826_C0432 [Nitratiruptor sp. YY08-26]
MGSNFFTLKSATKFLLQHFFFNKYLAKSCYHYNVFQKKKIIQKEKRCL